MVEEKKQPSKARILFRNEIDKNNYGRRNITDFEEKIWTLLCRWIIFFYRKRKHLLSSVAVLTIIITERKKNLNTHSVL